MIEEFDQFSHVALIVDESRSMHHLSRLLVKVADGQIERLARRSQQLKRETRVSVYTFNDTVRCPIFDVDVQRLPSLAGRYHPQGRTALIDAILQAIGDLRQTAQMHGKHSFLLIALTDGGENQSRAKARDLRQALGELPENWTLACLVPDQLSKDDAQSFGIPPGNIAVWDANNAAGLEEAGSVIGQGIDTFLTGQSQGVRGTKTLFSTGIETVNSSTVRAALTPLASSAYAVLPVREPDYIRPFVEATGRTFVKGRNFYQMTKPELVQRNKDILVREKKTGQVFAGPQGRDLLGLVDMDVRVPPDDNPKFDVFIQSNSVNRLLVSGTDLILLLS